MSAQHTPGPWRVTTDGYTIDAPFAEYRGIKTYTEIAIASETTIEDHAEIKANARLIAAAPMLLANCKGLIAALRHNGVEHHTEWVSEYVDLCESAIAAAEGR